MQGLNNALADPLSRIAIAGSSFGLDYNALAKAQAADEELSYIRQNPGALIVLHGPRALVHGQ